MKPLVKIRKIIQVGRTYYINLPTAFIKRHGLKKGDYLPILTNHIVKIVPMLEENFEEKPDESRR